MAYDQAKHNVFAERMRNWVRELKQLYAEAGDMDDIYLNEGESGNHAAFVDHDIATEAELVDGIILMRRLRDALALDGQSNNLTSEDQTARITPFLQ